MRIISMPPFIHLKDHWVNQHTAVRGQDSYHVYVMHKNNMCSRSWGTDTAIFKSCCCREPVKVHQGEELQGQCTTDLTQPGPPHHHLSSFQVYLLIKDRHIVPVICSSVAPPEQCSPCSPKGTSCHCATDLCFCELLTWPTSPCRTDWSTLNAYAAKNDFRKKNPAISSSVQTQPCWYY